MTLSGMERMSVSSSSRVITGAVCGGEAFHPVVAELFGSEVFWAPFVDMVDGAA